MPGTSRGAQAGFTLIELIVVIILLGMAMALVMRPLLDAFQASSTGQSESSVQHQAKQAMDTIWDDMVRVMAPDRDPSNIRDVVLLHRGVLGNTIYSQDPRDGGAPLDIRDITVATATRLSVRGDFTQDPGYECVVYDAPAASSARFWITRTIWTTSGCGGTSRASYLVRPGPRIAGRTPATPFRYQLICSRDPQDGCGASSNAPAGDPCRPWTRTSASGAERNWITAVGVSFGAVESRGGGMAETAVTSWVTIRSRETSLYRRALGCG